MPKYLVKWEINIEADNPKEAAHEACKMQQQHDNQALVFNVLDESINKEVVIDLLEEEEHEE